MKRILLIGTFFLLAATVNYAQHFSIGPEVGYYKQKDADKGSFLFGGSARLTFGLLGVEGAIHYREDKYYNDAVKIQRYPISVSGLIFPLPFVYACAGIDWINSKTTVNLPGVSGDTSSDLGYHFGAGVHLSLGSIVLKGDARYVMIGKMKIPSSGEIDESVLVLSAGLLFTL